MAVAKTGMAWVWIWGILVTSILGQDQSAGEAVPFVSLQLAEGQSSEPIEVSKFSWLTGCWKGKGLGGDCVEIWGDPLGDTLIGGFQFAQNGKNVFSEHFALIQIEDTVTLKLKHFDPQMIGWEEKDKLVEFKFIKQVGNKYHFSGLTYVNVGPDKLDVYVMFKNKDGQRTEQKFEFTRSR